MPAATPRRRLLAAAWVAALLAARAAAAPASALRLRRRAAGGGGGARGGDVWRRDPGEESPASGTPDGVAYLIDTLGRFKAFADSSKAELAQKHAEEDKQLQSDIHLSENEAVRAALEQSVTSNRESLNENSRIYDEMVRFSETMTGVLRGVAAKGTACDDIACGPHATCTVTERGADCTCNQGFVGRGSDCHAPAAFLPHRLILGSSSLQVYDVHVCAFSISRLAVVFRDAAQGDVGRMVNGHVRDAGVADFSPPEQFTASNEMAFSPVVEGMEGNRVVIAWRDAHQKGNCLMRVALLGTTGIRGADTAITWGQTQHFCEGQSHKMAFVTLPGGKLAVLYSDKAKTSTGSAEESFGNSVLASVTASGAINILGQFRFTDHAVCRLEVTKLTPSSFIVAARASTAVDEMDSTKSTKQEAMAIFAEFVENELVFDPSPVNLEPGRTQIWARGVSLVAPNTFAYAYQDGLEMKIKLAIVEVDPSTHHMQLVQGPQVIRDGFSPYVSMLPVPYSLSDPHTLVYYEDEVAKTSMVSVCTWTPSTKLLSQCEDFPWLDEKLRSVSGVHLGEGKSFFAFSTESGVPYYSVFGLSKK